MTFTFSPATRQGIKPLICTYGESNSGKTYSMLLLARGIAGPNGKILMGDTESGRGALYSNEIPGGYIRCDFQPPFSPDRMIAFFDEAEAQNPDVIILDSFSQEWAGEGGVLDIAGDNEASGKKGLSIWKAPKMAHARLVMRLMRSNTFVIVGLRAKYKSRQVKQNGKSEIVKDDHITAIQDDEFLFEATAHMEMQASNPGTIRLTKWSVPDLAKCFPKDGEEKISIKHGEMIARWASNLSAPTEAPKKGPSVDKLRARIIEIAAANGLVESGINPFLRNEGMIDVDDSIESLPSEKLLGIGKNLDSAIKAAKQKEAEMELQGSDQEF